MTRGTTQRETEDKQIVRERIGVRDSDKGHDRERETEDKQIARERIEVRDSDKGHDRERETVTGDKEGARER